MIRADTRQEASTIKVIIVGGGIAGLALAAGLVKKKHVDFHIYESVPAYKDVGAGLALHMNAIKAMALIGPEVRKAYFDKALSMGEENEEMVTEVRLAEGSHAGELVAELGKARGRKTVSRADLLQGLLELVPKERISFGKKLAFIEESAAACGVQVLFDDGEKARGDCLIGADGIHSLTRSYILGPNHPATSPKNHDGWQIYRTMIPMSSALDSGLNSKYTTVVPILLGPHGHVNTMPLNKSTRLSAGVAVRGAKFTESGEAPELDLKLYSNYTQEAQNIVRMVAKDTSASWTAADHDHAPTYFRSRVLMIGDAAHASLPFAGNGAAQALEDCAVIDCLFSEIAHPTQLEAAFYAFDALRRPRSQAVVDLARNFGRVYAYADEESMYQNPARMREFFKGAAAFTNDVDLDKQNEEAMRVFRTRIQQ